MWKHIKQVLQLLCSLQHFQIVSLTKPTSKHQRCPLIICSKMHTCKKWKRILLRPESTQKHKIKLQQPPILMVSKFNPLLFYALCFCCRLHLSTSVSTKDKSKALYVEYFMNNSNIWVNQVLAIQEITNIGLIFDVVDNLQLFSLHLWNKQTTCKYTLVVSTL